MDHVPWLWDVHQLSSFIWTNLLAISNKIPSHQINYLDLNEQYFAETVAAKKTYLLQEGRQNKEKYCKPSHTTLSVCFHPTDSEQRTAHLQQRVKMSICPLCWDCQWSCQSCNWFILSWSFRSWLNSLHTFLFLQLNSWTKKKKMYQHLLPSFPLISRRVDCYFFGCMCFCVLGRDYFMHKIPFFKCTSLRLLIFP